MMNVQNKIGMVNAFTLASTKAQQKPANNIFARKQDLPYTAEMILDKTAEKTGHSLNIEF